MTIQEEKFLPDELPTEIPAEAKSLHRSSHHTAEKEHYATQQHSTQLKTLLAWHAPGRPFRKRTKEYYIAGLLIMMLIEVILLLAQFYIAMLVVASLVFVAFALAIVPPHDYRYHVSTEGIAIEDHFYLWQELYDFYFKHRDTMDILHVRTRDFYPGELTIMLGTLHKDQVKDIFLRYLPYREMVQKTFVEKAGDWLAHTFPLEKSHS